MQLRVSFKALLATVVIALCACDEAVAAPTAFPIINGESNNSTITGRAPAPFRIPLTVIGDDLAYTASISIGTNPRPFVVTMDTGSSDFWVYSSVCEQRGEHNGIMAGGSTRMLTEPPTRWTIPYGEADSVNGIMGKDSIMIGNHVISPYGFGVAGVVSGSIPGGTGDGVLGLGTRLGSRMKVLNIVEVLALREGIPAPIMGWYLSRSRDGKHDAQLSLGAPN
ncbi:hypothetical protein EVG20_g6937, partial [Dentipellis fragilis]